MQRRLWVLLAVVGLAVTAGCLGGGDTPEPTTDVPTTDAPTQTTTTPTDTPTDTPAPTTTTTAPTTTTTVPSVHAQLVDPPASLPYDSGELTVAFENPASVPQTYVVTLVANRTNGNWYEQSYEFEGELSPGETHTATFTTDWGATGDWELVLDGERVAIVTATASSSYSSSQQSTPTPDTVSNGSVTGGATAR